MAFHGARALPAKGLASGSSFCYDPLEARWNKTALWSPVAQLVEQAAVNRWVAGSSPARGAKFLAIKVMSLVGGNVGATSSLQKLLSDALQKLQRNCRGNGAIFKLPKSKKSTASNQYVFIPAPNVVRPISTGFDHGTTGVLFDVSVYVGPIALLGPPVPRTDLVSWRRGWKSKLNSSVTGRCRRSPTDIPKINQNRIPRPLTSMLPACRSPWTQHSAARNEMLSTPLMTERSNLAARAVRISSPRTVRLISAAFTSRTLRASVHLSKAGTRCPDGF